MNGSQIAKLMKEYEQVQLSPNAKTMEEVVAYIENNWHGHRAKIKESHYVIHYKNALEYAKQLGKDMTGKQEEIRRYVLPNGIGIILGMQTEYITAEDGMKYYQALHLYKGLTKEDIETKNDRWLNYILMLQMQKEWDEKEQSFLAEQQAELERRTAELEAESSDGK